MPTYYVSKTGDNGNSGTSWGDSWLTIQYGINNISSGDTLLIGPGTYLETLVIPDFSSTTTIQGPDISTNTIMNDTYTVIVNSVSFSDGANVVLENLYVITTISLKSDIQLNNIFVNGGDTLNCFQLREIVSNCNLNRCIAYNGVYGFDLNPTNVDFSEAGSIGGFTNGRFSVHVGGAAYFVHGGDISLISLDSFTEVAHTSGGSWNSWGQLTVGTYLYICGAYFSAEGFSILDKSSLSNYLLEPGSEYISGTHSQVCNNSTMLYQYDGDNGVLQVVDCGTPIHPIFRGSCSAPNSSIGPWVYDPRGYVYTPYLSCIDVRDPDNPSLVYEYNVNFGYHMCQYGGNLFIASRNNNRLYIFDTTNPASPTLVGTCTNSIFHTVTGMVVSQDFLYIIDDDASVVRVVDVNDKTFPFYANKSMGSADYKSLHIYWMGLTNQYLLSSFSGSFKKYFITKENFDSLSNVSVTNSIAHSCSAGYIIKAVNTITNTNNANRGGRSFVCDGCPGSGSIDNSYPFFVDYGNMDFRLFDKSPYIDAGTSNIGIYQGSGANSYRYVSKSGDNANGGTSWGDSWLTIQYGVDNITPGMSLYVGEGYYNEVVIPPDYTYYVDIVGAGLDLTQKTIVPDIEYSNSAVGIRVLMANPTGDMSRWRNFYIREGINCYNVRYITIQDCIIYTSGQSGCRLQNDCYDNLIVNCTAYSNTYNGSGFTISSFNTNRNIIRNCIASHFHYGFQCDGAGNTVEYCTAYDNNWGSYSGTATYSNMLTSNPIFVDPLWADLRLFTGSPCFSSGYGGVNRGCFQELSLGLNLYVSLTGDNNNDGSQSSPWRTIQYAANNNFSGSIVNVGPGWFGETVTPRDHNRSTTITGQDLSTRTILVDGFNSSGIATMRNYDAGDNITWKNFRVTGQAQVRNTLNVTFENIFFDENIGTNVFWGSTYSNITFKHCISYKRAIGFLCDANIDVYNCIAQECTTGFSISDSSHCQYNDAYNNGTNFSGSPGTGCITLNPLFLNTSREDYRLKSTSPCLGTGESGENIGIFRDSTITGRNYDVSKSGSNDNTGESPDDAWLTIQYAIDQIYDADIINIDPGNYDENISPPSYFQHNITITGPDMSSYTIFDDNTSVNVTSILCDNCGSYTTWKNMSISYLYKTTGAITNVIFENILFTPTSSQSFDNDVSNIIFRRCDAYGLAGIAFTSITGKIEVYDCIAYQCLVGIVTGNSHHNCAYGCWTNFSGTPGPGSISGDPAFLDYVNGDFRLWASSPCIGAGLSNIGIYQGPGFIQERVSRKFPTNLGSNVGIGFGGFSTNFGKMILESDEE